MNDTRMVEFELDEDILKNLDTLAKTAGMTREEYLRELLLDRAAAHLKQQEAGGSLFLT